MLLGACSRSGGGGGHTVLEPTVCPSPGKLVLEPRRRNPQNSTYCIAGKFGGEFNLAVC